MKRLSLIFLGLALGFEVHAQPKFTLTQFALPQGARSVFPTDINDNGEVTGSVVYDHGERPFRWTATAGYTILNRALAGGRTSINNQGLITGQYNPRERAFIWHPDGQFEDLGVPSGEESSRGTDINDDGVVIGGQYRWIRGLGWQVLDPNRYAHARKINQVGEIAGYVGVNDRTTHAFLWTELGGTEDVGTLPAAREPPSVYNTYSHGLNNIGHMVGAVEMESSDRSRLVDSRAFIWSRDEGMRDLGRLGERVNPWNEARSINDHEEVVGSSNGRAFYWTKTSGMLDLNNLVIKNSGRFRLEWAASINNGGEIVVVGYIPGSASRSGFLLQPIR